MPHELLQELHLVQEFQGLYSVGRVRAEHKMGTVPNDRHRAARGGQNSRWPPASRTSMGRKETAEKIFAIQMANGSVLAM